MKNYLESALAQFRYYKMLGDKSMAQLEDEALFWSAGEEGNSIAVIVKHLWGKMLSRWTDFLTSDGEKEWRNREGEFEADIKDRAELLEKWEAGWACLFAAIDSVEASNYDQVIYIRNQGHTITEAMNRQLCHYAYHVGQMVFLAKMQKGDAWESLSIPRGGSKAYNAEKFAQEKKKAHFTAEYLEKDQDQEK